MNSIELLISTMNKQNNDFLLSMNLTTDAIIVNQNEEKNNIETYRINNNQVKQINSLDKGLSNSRNEAIKHSTADICIIADDDMSYETELSKKVLCAYRKYPDADIIAFQVKRKGNALRGKTFRKKKSWENYITSMKISSVEITFKRESIIKNQISFNPNFGAGTDLPQGEENLFLYDALNKGLKILYLPINIGEVNVNESSWFEGYDKKYLYTMGAKFYKMSKKAHVLLILQYALRRHKLYKGKFSIFQIIRLMFKGKKLYRKKYEQE